MKTKNIITIILSLIILGSCGEEFLETKMIDKKSDINYYANPEEVYKALIGCYDGLQLIYSYRALPVVAETLSDNCFGGTGNGDAMDYRVLDRYDLSHAPAEVNLFDDTWKQYYKAIFRCNTLISKLDNVNWKTDAKLRPIYESEARFIRAYCYFDLTRLFGKVPLLTHPNQAKENMPRASVDEIYKLIAEDLEYGASNGLATDYPSIPASQKGRITKWAAKALLARVYLFYTGYYNKSDLAGITTAAEALQGLEDIISDGKFGLVENYFDLFPASATYEAATKNISISKNTYAEEDNKETIFAIKYTYTSNYSGNTDGNHWEVMNGIRLQAVGKYGYGNGWGANTVLPDLWNAFEPGDKRKTASIISIADEGINFTQLKDQREYTGYYLKKYTPTCDSAGKSIAVSLGGVNFMIGQFHDFVAIRYADVLLMAAELGSVNAQKYFDDVRARAGLSSIPLTTEALRNERRFEFVGEAIRFWDLLRYDHTLDYAAKAVSITATTKSGGNDDVVVIDGEKLKITKGLQQIPKNQITLSNNVLDQNPGWE